MTIFPPRWNISYENGAYHHHLNFRAMSQNVFSTLGLTIGFIFLILVVKYKMSIRRRMKQFQRSILFGKPSDPFRMVRIKSRTIPEKNSSDSSSSNSSSSEGIDDRGVEQNFRFLTLNELWVQKQALNPRYEHVRMMSMGDYLSSLRPYLGAEGRQLPEFVEQEFQNALAAALLKGLGPMFGQAALPALQFSGATGMTQKLTGYLFGKNADVATAATTASEGDSKTVDRGGVNVSLSAMTYAAEVNYQKHRHRELEFDHSSSKEVVYDQNKEEPGPEHLKKAAKENARVSSTSAKKTPLDNLRDGEVAYDPSFSGSFKCANDKNSDNLPQPFIPNPFVIHDDWDNCVSRMEQILSQTSPSSVEEYDDDEGEKKPTYDPNSKALPSPVPIDQRWLPDLHSGYGACEGTHTQREILYNRLLSVLLNKLASNYYFVPARSSLHEHPPFTVKMRRNSNDLITKPDQLIKELMNMGHKIECCVRSNATTFGQSLCVKDEDEETWTSIPMAMFLQSVHTDNQGNDAYVCLPHSGLDMEIREGPLLMYTSLQHFIGPQGLCGWYSNHNADAPWIQKSDCGPVMTSVSQVTEAVRVAAMEAVVLCSVGTQLQLPLGGYGLTGVCNDSAALVEYALTGTTNVYPLTFNGRFAMHTLRTAQHLRGKLKRQEDMESLDKFLAAVLSLKSDLNALPVDVEDEVRRQFTVLPEDPAFGLMSHTIKVLKNVKHEIQQAKEQVTNSATRKSRSAR